MHYVYDSDAGSWRLPSAAVARILAAEEVAAGCDARCYAAVLEMCYRPGVVSHDPVAWAAYADAERDLASAKAALNQACC